jgi:hypothetical protein
MLQFYSNFDAQSTFNKSQDQQFGYNDLLAGFLGEQPRCRNAFSSKSCSNKGFDLL